MEMVPIKNHKRPLKTPEIKGCTAWGCRVPAPSFIAERGNHARSNVQPVAALICSKNSPHCMESPGCAYCWCSPAESLLSVLHSTSSEARP
eukprot:scaffold286696_cov14-Tisochrysis_lutea.AAC.2